MNKLFPFDECYLINLVERPDRLKYMQKQFKDLNCENEIILHRAVKYPSWILEKFKRGINENEDFVGYIDEYNTISCTREHYTLIKSAYLRGVKTLLIIEDDCGFIKDRSVLEEYFNNLPIDWDILRINCLRGPKTQQYIEDFKDKYSYWYPQESTLFGTGAYALSRNGMKYMLDWFDKYYTAIDIPLVPGNLNNPCEKNLYIARYKNIDTSNVKFYIPTIPLGLCKTLDSDIRESDELSESTLYLYNMYKYIKEIDINDYH